MYDPKPVELANQFHQATYATPATVQAYAPGRIEILGNHTDYNAGTTLSTAINQVIAVVLSPSDTSGVNLSAANLDQSIHFDPTTDETLNDEYQWANYVKGVSTFCVRMESRSTTSTAPLLVLFQWERLSSSAALEVATAYALIEYAGGQLNPITIAKVAQAAEQRFAGCNCGLLDQFSSIFGVPSGLIHSDFRTLETASVALPAEARFIMINPHIQHALAESPYNVRRSSCEKPPRNSMHYSTIRSNPAGCILGRNSPNTAIESIPKPRNALNMSLQKSPGAQVLNCLNNRIFTLLDNYSMIARNLPHCL